MKKQIVLGAVALAVAASMSSAGIIGFGASSTAYDASVVPTYNVAPGGTLNAAIWIAAQGSGRIQTVSFGIREANAATAPNVDVGAATWPWLDWLSSPLLTPGEAHTGGFVSPSVGAAGVGASIVTSFGGTTLVGNPSAPITTTPRHLLSLSGTVTATPGTYYLYLHRTGSNITEAPSFTEVTAAQFPGLSVTALSSSVRFGNDGAAGALPAGSGLVANFGQRSSLTADAIIVVAAVSTGPSISLISGGDNPALVPGNGVNYLPTATNGGVFQFAGTNTGATLVAFDLVGGSGLPDGLTIPAGATASTNDLGIFGPGFDFVVNFGNLGSGPFTASISGLGAGVSLRATSAIPEPAALGFLAPVALLAARRRRA